MKKTIILTTALILFAGASAYADVSVGLSFGEPAPVYPAPAYVAPEPGYVLAPDWPSEHYDIHRHRHNDYWARHGYGHREHEHARR